MTIRPSHVTVPGIFRTTRSDSAGSVGSAVHSALAGFPHHEPFAHAHERDPTGEAARELLLGKSVR